MNALLIQSSQAHSDEFLLVCDKLLNHRPAEKVDASPRRLSEVQRWMMLLDGFGVGAEVGLHAHLSFLVWAPHDIIHDFTEYCGLPFVTTDTQNYQFTAAVITGSYNRWVELLREPPDVLKPLTDAIRTQMARI